MNSISYLVIRTDLRLAVFMLIECKPKIIKFRTNFLVKSSHAPLKKPQYAGRGFVGGGG